MTAYILILLLTALIAYCSGSLSTAVLASNFVFRRNLRKLGEGNIGLSNFRRVFGVSGFIRLALVEIVKDAVPLVIGGLLLGIKGHSQVGIAFAGFCMVLGRLFPVFYGFKGSHASLCLIIAAVAVDSAAGIVALLFFGAVVWFSRYVSFGTMAAALVYILVALMQVDDKTTMLLCVFTGLAVLLKHIPALRRLLRREELKLSFEKDISYKFDQRF